MVMGCWEGAAKSPWRRQLHTKRFTVTAPAPPLAPLLCYEARVAGGRAPGVGIGIGVVMIHPQVHLRIPCYDFTFL